MLKSDFAFNSGPDWLVVELLAVQRLRTKTFINVENFTV